MPVTHQDIEEVLRNTDVVAVIQKFVPLIQIDAHRWRGVCPFELHDADVCKAKFWVDQQKKVFYCFSCHASGHVLRFLVMKHKITAPDALARLRKLMEGQ
jgi:DNA primase